MRIAQVLLAALLSLIYYKIVSAWKDTDIDLRCIHMLSRSISSSVRHIRYQSHSLPRIPPDTLRMGQLVDVLADRYLCGMGTIY